MVSMTNISIARGVWKPIFNKPDKTVLTGNYKGILMNQRIRACTQRDFSMAYNLFVKTTFVLSIYARM